MTKHLTGTREEWLTARLKLLKAEHGAPAAVDWLSFAAAPTFAVMAFVTEVHGGGPLAALCASGPGGSSMDGMTVMYALMSVFHTPPWLRLVARRRRAADPDDRVPHHAASGAAMAPGRREATANRAR